MAVCLTICLEIKKKKYETFAQNVNNAVRIQRYFNVHTMSSQRYGRSIDVETMLCVQDSRRHNTIITLLLNGVGP